MARIERQRPGPRQRLYTHEWDLERAAWLIDNPRCVVCGRPATVVDHITDHRGDEALFWNKSNLQSLCAPHHAAKTMKTINERRRQA